MASKERCSMVQMALLLVLVAWLPTVILADLARDGKLDLLVAVPLTENDQHVDPGWIHMASALMAVDHFNTRNATVVPQLADQQLQDCNIQFGNITVIDTGTNSHKAMEQVSQLLLKGDNYLPDAIAGPYNEIPALELSGLANGLKIPIVSHRASNYNLALTPKHPYFTSVGASVYGEMEFLGTYLQHTQRTNYIAVLHAMDETTLQRVEILRGVLRRLDITKVELISYLSPATPIEGSLHRDIPTAMQVVKDTGYRTIMIISTHLGVDSKEIGQSAMELGLDVGDHLWIILGGSELSSLHKLGVLYEEFELEQEYNTTTTNKKPWKFWQGAAYLDSVDRFQAVSDGTDPFNQSLHFQNATFVQKLREANPIPNYYREVWDPIMNSTFPPDDIFKMITYPNEGTSYMYDAVMAIGIGACNAVSSNNNAFLNISGDDLLAGIRSADFSGASGQVRFGTIEGNPGSRDGATVYFGVFNLLPFGLTENRSLLSEVAAFYHPDTGELKEVGPFIYADGTTSPPELLRDTPERNYLSDGARAVGLTLFGIAIGAAILCSLWVICYRHHQVIIAAQPLFLHIICFGSALVSFAIFMASFDENRGWSQEQLDKACKSIPWLETIGFICVYMALFTKLWRVNKVLQFRRRQINVQHVMWPTLIVVIIALIILSVWTATSDFGWTRFVINDETGESIGSCDVQERAMYIFAICTIIFIPIVMTLVLAWKTRDVDDLYSESKWIFALILVQFQVMIVGTPTIIVLRSVDTDGRYIGLSLLVWTFPMTNVGLILVPKMVAVYLDGKAAAQGRPSNNSVARGSRLPVRVSGFPSPTGNPRGSTEESMTPGATQADPSVSSVPANDSDQNMESVTIPGATTILHETPTQTVIMQ